MNTRDFPAKIIEVHDGDTVKVEIDIGFDLKYTSPVRIFGVNCPELPTDAGDKARDYVKGLMPVGSEFVLRAQKSKDKYGRVLGDFVIGDKLLSQLLLDGGYAVVMRAATIGSKDNWL